jgi:hypothetical protein
MPPRPTHKKRRILKKRLKRWARDVATRKQVFAFMAAMQRPTYRCVACNRKEGFYAAMGRNLIVIERLPDRPGIFLAPEMDVVGLLLKEEEVPDPK